MNFLICFISKKYTAILNRDMFIKLSTVGFRVQMAWNTFVPH